MTAPSPRELEGERERLYAQLAAVGDFRRRSVEGIKKTELDTALGYFENNAPRMPCHWFRGPRPVHRLRSSRIRLQSSDR